MRIIRNGSWTAVPWKNGSGTTHEVIRFPATGADFGWRLSVARIEASGAFSDFTGYHRHMVLLGGAGLHLTFDDAKPASLLHIGDMVQFGGALKTDCRLIGGGCTDLNLIVSRSMRGSATIERLREPRLLPSRDAGSSLVFNIAGALTVECGQGAAACLQPWDLAVIPRGADALLVVDPGASPLVFCATLDDNPR